jgi:hypothetical protein
MMLEVAIAPREPISILDFARASWTKSDRNWRRRSEAVVSAGLLFVVLHIGSITSLPRDCAGGSDPVHRQLPSIRAPAATDTTLPNMGRLQRHVDLGRVDPLSVVQAIDKLINFVVLSSEHDIILVSIPAVPCRLLSRVL